MEKQYQTHVKSNAIQCVGRARWHRPRKKASLLYESINLGRLACVINTSSVHNAVARVNTQELQASWASTTTRHLKTWQSRIALWHKTTAYYRGISKCKWGNIRVDQSASWSRQLVQSIAARTTISTRSTYAHTRDLTSIIQSTLREGP